MRAIDKQFLVNKLAASPSTEVSELLIHCLFSIYGYDKKGIDKNEDVCYNTNTEEKNSSTSDGCEGA